MGVGFGALVCVGSSLLPEQDVGGLSGPTVKAASLDGPRTKGRTKGIVVTRRISIPEDSIVVAQKNPDLPDPSGGTDQAIDLDGARLVYRVSGGLAAVDNVLRILPDGSVTYDWSNSIGDRSGSVQARLSEEEMTGLKVVFQLLGFESLPAEFEQDGGVADGVDILVAAEVRKDKPKSVLSHTGSIEDPRFMALRVVLDELIDELLSEPVTQGSENS
jgi:hypothetical protein